MAPGSTKSSHAVAGMDVFHVQRGLEAGGGMKKVEKRGAERREWKEKGRSIRTSLRAK